MKHLLLITATLLSILATKAQETTVTNTKNQQHRKINIDLKDTARPDIYVNGKKFNFPLELIDQNQVESISVLKDEHALKQYNAPNGVLLITTKKAVNNLEISEVKATENLSKSEPMVLIDGKIADKKMLEKILPDAIESINIFKGKQALEKYNAPNGVILVKTKKKN